MPDIAALMDDLVTDAWRDETPFSRDVASCEEQLLNAQADDDRIRALSAWLGEHQPCLFGVLAARRGWIEFCFLTDDDLRRGDRHVAGKIAQSRLAWRRKARDGSSHAFIVLALSERIARAEPNAALLEFARHLAELYLCRRIDVDRVFHDELFLEAAESRSWRVGVNFFSAQGDGRWWKDHRVPGGVAFSMNSVGHMACVRRISRSRSPETEGEGLHWALRVAMQLLDGTTEGPSGRNTWLVSVDEIAPSAPCPVQLPGKLQGKNWCQYAGQYHTDYTLPSVYFTPAVSRPPVDSLRDLDLTYLFNDSPENPDFQAMGRGATLP